jgi:aspartate/tyrosine/aromatic aminotransferase
MLESLRALPKNSVVIFHPVGHNPTGFDPSQDQWKQILEISKEKEFFNIFDMAY